jgi:DNA gyrase/topoisomerase IV subunit B
LVAGWRAAAGTGFILDLGRPAAVKSVTVMEVYVVEGDSAGGFGRSSQAGVT